MIHLLLTFHIMEETHVILFYNEHFILHKVISNHVYLKAALLIRELHGVKIHTPKFLPLKQECET